MRHTLGKSEKLKSRKQIEQLFKVRQFVTLSPIRVFYTFEKKLQKGAQVQVSKTDVKAGFSCSKRFFKQATRRNRVKRLLREAYRSQKEPLIKFCEEYHCNLSIFWIYGNNELPGLQEVETKVGKLIAKLNDKLVASLQTKEEK